MFQRTVRIVKVRYLVDMLNQSGNTNIPYNEGFSFTVSDLNPGYRVQNQKPINLNSKNNLIIFPNPTSSQTTIKYNLQQFGKANIYLTDITGKKISQIMQNKEHDAGDYEVEFVRKDIPNGMYFIVLETLQEKIVKKLFLN